MLTRLLLAIWLAAAANYTDAQTASTPDTPRGARIAAFVSGNVAYILLHELAHLVIRDLDVPVIGSEESAADYIATIALINAAEFDPSSADRARGYLAATANGLVTTWEVYERSGQSAKYWDGHGLTIQRFYNVVCLLYGSDQDGFADLPSRIGLPANRANRCSDEYTRAYRALKWLISNYGHPDDASGTRQHRLVIDTPPTRSSATIMQAFDASGMVENTLRLFNEQFTLPTDFQLTFKRCGQFQAGWYPQDRELVFCYELIDYYYSLGATAAANNRPSILEP